MARELGGREAGESRPRGRKAKAPVLRRGEPQEPRLDPLGLARLHELAADRLQERVRYRRRPQRPQAVEEADRPAEQRIAGEALEKGRVVVVRGEHEAQALERLGGASALQPDAERPVGALPHAGERGLAAALEHEREDSVPEAPGGVAGGPRRERERVRRSREEGGLESQRVYTTPPAGRLSGPRRTNPIKRASGQLATRERDEKQLEKRRKGHTGERDSPRRPLPWG